MSSAIYNVFGADEGGGRYKAVVRAKLKGQYVRKYFATKTEAKTWAEMKNIEAENWGKEHVEFPNRSANAGSDGGSAFGITRRVVDGSRQDRTSNHRDARQEPAGGGVRKGLRLDNPLSKLRKKIHNGEVSILSVKDAELVLKAAQSDEIGFVALALFCGIRTAEFQKIVRNARGEEHRASLDWKEVDLKARHVFISPELDKNRHGRYVDIPGNAISWLKMVQQSVGVITPENWRMRRQALETRSGVKLPQNVFRHSFCSYRISLDQDYAKAAAIVGNSPAMLRKHYVRVLPKKLGQAYFKISLPK